MAIDLNQDVGKIIKDLFAKKNKGSSSGNIADEEKKGFDENYKNAILKSVITVCITAAAVWGVHKMTANPVQKAKSEFQTTEILKEELDKLDKNISSSRKILQNNKNKVEKILPEFSKIGGSKNLYKLISDIGDKSSITIKNITQGITNEIKEPIKYTETTLFLEIEAYYSNYMDFRRQLSQSKPILQFNEEKLLLDKNRSDRKLVVVITIKDFSVEKDAYEKLLKEQV